MTKADTHGADAGALEKVGDKVASAYAATRDAAVDAAHGTATGIDANPLIALLGGIAIGAIAGALVPRSEKEQELLAPLGARVGEAARAAFEAAKAAGGDTLDQAGVSQDNIRQQLAKLVEQMFKAAGNAGSAAFSAARDASAK